MKSCFAFTFAFLLVTASPFARGQAAPAATAGTADLQYALRYAETANFTDTLGTWHSLDTSGSLNYTNGHERRPLSLDYTGGYSSTISGPSYSTGAFHRLMVTQGFNWHKWILTLGDDVGYRPQAPTTGYSGIPGIGEPIGTGPTSPTSQLILTVNTHALNNDATGQIQHIIARGSTFAVDVHDSLLRYPDGNGLDTDELSIGTGPTLRLNARQSLLAHYSFSRFSYSVSDSQFETDTLTVGYERTWSRTVSSRVSIGPEWIRASALVPASTQVSVQASLDYRSRNWSSSLGYNRGASGGSGYLMGTESDSATASFSRSFAKTVALEMSGGYRHTSQLAQQGNIAGEFGGVQASWRIGRHVNAFANYTATCQSSTAQVPSNVLSELQHTVSFGIGFSKDIRATR